jgi:uncharacterized membrane protein YdbT with pleckstrin-like domain
MSYVDKHLLPGEKVTYRTRLHWKSYIAYWLIALFVFLPLAVWMTVSNQQLLALIPAILAGITWMMGTLHRDRAEFAVTDRRIIIKFGILSTRSIEIMLPKVEAISVSQSMWGRMFNFGDIVVTGSGGTKEPFTGIQAPEQFRHAVQTAAHAAGGGVSSNSG